MLSLHTEAGHDKLEAVIMVKAAIQCECWITIGCTPSDVDAFEFVSHLRRRVILDVMRLNN